MSRVSATEVERWAVFELELEGEAGGNPWVDVTLHARFTYGHRTVKVGGFYDGDGLYRVRFMPDVPGQWSYETQSNCGALHGRTGSFTCVEPAEHNHGLVRVADTFHFAYADGTPYYQVGTTCYAWAHQGDELEEQTLATLREAPFNKLRMCVFPKNYTYNENEPVYYPFERRADGGWDFARFSPAFFRHFEKRVGQLMELGIEADVILFHPYDYGRWGFDRMSPEQDDRYLRYVIARLAAYRNVWWSLANEYDLMEGKSMADWDRFFRILWQEDPCQHLRSVHNCRTFYDHGKPWVTHCSIQSGTDSVAAWRETYRKPVVVDECRYEGNVEQGWGNIGAQELVHRFWTGTVRGGYVGHGETYLHPHDILWWSKGGVLHGESPARIAFLRRLLEDGPPGGLDPVRWGPHWDMLGAAKGDDYCLFYFGEQQPAHYTFEPPGEARYRVDVIDPWQMTIEPLEGTFGGRFRIELPGRPFIAVRMRKA